MFRSVFRRLLTLMLALSLVLGQGVAVPVMAASMVNDAQSGILSVAADSSDEAGCCPMCDKDQHTDHGMKGGDCAAFCATTTQAALPSHYPVFVRQAMRMAYDTFDATATSRPLSPDYPPPKV